MKKINILFVLIFLLSCEKKETAINEHIPEQFKEIHTIIDSVFQSTGVAGIAISIGIDGKIIWNNGYGYADVEQEVEIDPSKSLFRVGSVAKPMTAAAIARLYQEKKLDLDAPVQTYVPSFPKKKWDITTRQLAGHLAGIRHYNGDEFLSSKFYPTVNEGLDIFKDDPLLHEPGTKYQYSSYGWNLISAVIEGASNTPFLDYMQMNVFDKIGMNHTYADYVKPIIKHRGRYYKFEGETLINAEWVDNSYKWAGGGFLSTSDDLVRFGFAHLNESILKKETIDVLWESQKTSDGELTNYGLGWRSGTLSDGTGWVGHSGGSVGGSTMFMIIPDKNIVIVMITNMSSFGMSRYTYRVAEILLK